jgi:hypothetical protein
MTALPHGRTFTRPQHGPGPPRIGRMMQPAPALTPDEDYPPAEDASDETLWVESAEICPLVLLHVHDNAGNTLRLNCSLATFLPLARQVIALDDGDTQYQDG